MKQNTDQLQTALQAVTKAVQEPVQTLSQLPHRNALNKPPKTLAEALAVVVARDEEKKRKEGKRDYKGKGKSSAFPHELAHAPPGTVPGYDREVTAFWLLMEEYCRELVADDLEVLRPKYDNPLDDPSFYVPPLGRLYEPDDGSMQTHIATLQFGQDAIRRRAASAGATPSQPEAASEQPADCKLNHISGTPLQTVADLVAELQQLPASKRPPTADDPQERDQKLRAWLTEQAHAMADAAHTTDTAVTTPRGTPKTPAATGAGPSTEAGAGAGDAPTTAAAGTADTTVEAVREHCQEVMHPYTRLLLAVDVPEHVYTLPPPPAAAVDDGGRAGAATPTLDAEGTPMDTEEGPGGAAQGCARSTVNYSTMSGKRPWAAKAGVRPVTLAAPAAVHPAAVAVNNVVAQGGNVMNESTSWKQLQAARPIISSAPDDEILAELFACQQELLTQMLCNRNALAPILEAAAADLPQHTAAREARNKMAEDMKAIVMRAKELRRQAKRQKREEAAQAAKKSMEANIVGSPGRVTLRTRVKVNDHMDTEDSDDDADSDDELLDRLAEREEEESAECGVCGDGDSYENNPILFCDRCNLAVHQHCYNVTRVPEGDWLCWPCKEYEDQQRALGVPAAQIRMPRWQTAHDDGYKVLDGGSRSVSCALCPIKHGTFRKATNGEWVHQACALWNPSLQVQAVDAAMSVSGVEAAKTNARCGLCGQDSGAVIKCSFGHCMTQFHVLCGRNHGNYLSIREQGGKKVYRAYCSLHSQQMRIKDEQGETKLNRGNVVAKGDGRKVKGRIRSNRLAALQTLAQKESELEVCNSIRFELETVRLLAERIHKREKVKEKLARACQRRDAALLEAGWRLAMGQPLAEAEGPPEGPSTAGATPAPEEAHGHPEGNEERSVDGEGGGHKRGESVETPRGGRAGSAAKRGGRGTKRGRGASEEAGGGSVLEDDMSVDGEESEGGAHKGTAKRARGGGARRR